MNRTSLVLALVIPSLLFACGAGENTVGTDWPDAGTTPDTRKPNVSTPGAAKLDVSAQEACITAGKAVDGQIFEISNPGTVASGALTASLSGSDATSFFISSNTCTGSTLAPGAKCSVAIFYDPGIRQTSTGSASLIVTDGVASVQVQIHGSDGNVSTSPAALSFGTVAAGIPSDELFVFVTTACKTGWTAAIDNPNFMITTNTCTGAAVAACQIGMRFAPPQGTSAKSSAGLLTITASDTSNVTVALSGIISPIWPSPAPLSASVALLDLGEVKVGEVASGIIQVDGAKAPPTAVISGSPSFVIADNTCKIPDQPCFLKIQFAPTVAGASSAILELRDGKDTVTVNLSGKGIPAPAGLTASPAVLNLGEVKVGESATGIITVNGAKASPAAMISGSAAFSMVANTCKAAGETCTIQIQFAPTEAGASSATLTISDGQTMVTVALQGQGFPASVLAPFAATPTALDFGQVQVTFTSTPLVVTVSTPSARSFKLTLSGSTASEMAIVQDTCTGSLLIPAGGTCAIGLIYKPTKTGNFEGTLNISDGTNTVSVHLTGTGWTLL